MFSSLFKFIFGATVLSGLLLGGSVILVVRYFAKYGLFKKDAEGEPIGLLNNFRNHWSSWTDIVLSTTLLLAGLSSPSIAIPLSIAGIIISLYVRVLTKKSNYNNLVHHYSLLKNKVVSLTYPIRVAIVNWLHEVREEVTLQREAANSRG